ncbi:glutamate racemase [candidate division WOR-1 bacterium RIFOXYB2_FULL_42_35]|uniref:Glutamate racemase n=1 Tax=candidate division WOR-1 bacterium RIFOXYC2_FULL_41_25 TaxID=1802586 RepID=A0A1F4TM10_UNCSA|nr:MAG: glutamate racemase [candidate division WOR-1 bacterium RIFOXYA2_FULL_41_14]OGC23635.1 MAG: glutamate racemase [candidate division WOR-1 bacterium RIFOXYB2_FULL_42_35]OGC33599.1 MAG: glutamate racemase [candidate division WOR-1 bacterium RIFOXYC2_FULL_41_25]OGC41755.1 MAG: glutamate racemase [candidate division WOR-1 bacterium RIFOXYD2_FULL_41_8]
MGIFDSGVGGLSVLAEVMRQLPHEDVIYLGDTARIPYGSRTPQEIVKINREIIPFLLKQGAKLIIMACGTSSAIAYPVIKDEYPVEIINLIEPGSQAAVTASRSGKIGVIATSATVNSQAFQDKIRELKKEAVVSAVGCPLFVPLIERGLVDSDEAKQVAKDYLKPLLENGIDALILGCTHYPHLAKTIQSIVGPGVKLVDPAEEAVKQTRKLLETSGTIRKESGPHKYNFFVTGSTIQFQDIGSRLLGKPIVGTKQISLT